MGKYCTIQRSSSKQGRPYEWSGEQVQSVLESYERGQTTRAIASAFGVGRSAIRSLLRRNQVSMRPSWGRRPPDLSWTPEQLRAIGSQYLDGSSTVEVGEAFGVSPTYISHLLKSLGIEVRGPSEVHRIYTVNHGYFEVIDDPDRAYWLGFLAADGCISAETNNVIVSLAAADEGHLRKFLDCLESDYLIYPAVARTQARIVITSARIVADLVRHRVTPRKSLTLKPPDFLPEELWSHYWRGVFDGDGTIYESGGGWRVGWSGTRVMMERVREWVQSVCLTKARVRPLSSIYRFEVGGICFPLAVAKALYYRSRGLIRLDRKYERCLWMVDASLLSSSKVVAL